jgi:hypothetical protein
MIGTQLDNYRVVGKLGDGGMGIPANLEAPPPPPNADLSSRALPAF